MGRAGRIAGQLRHHPLLVPAIILLIGLIAFPGFTVLYVTSANNAQGAQISRDRSAVLAADDLRWCATLRTLVSLPSLPPDLRGDLVTLEKEFGCR